MPEQAGFQQDVSLKYDFKDDAGNDSEWRLAEELVIAFSPTVLSYY